MMNKVSEGMGKLFAKAGLSPNQWTILSLIPALLSLYFLVKDMYLYSAVFLAITALIEYIDGSVARATGQVFRLGSYLNSIVGRYIEGILIFGLLYAGLPDFHFPSSVWIILYMFGAIMTSYTKSAIKEKGLFDRELGENFFERPLRFILLFVGIILAVQNPLYLTYIIVVLAILSNITTVYRILFAIGQRR